MRQSRRVRAVRINPEAIVDMLTGKATPETFPMGIEVVRYGLQWETNSAIIILSHPDWAEVDPAHTIQLQDLKMETK